MNINKNITTDNADVATPTPPHILTTAQRPRPRMDWPALATLIIGVPIMALVVLTFARFALPVWVFYSLAAALILAVFLPIVWFVKQYILTDVVAGVPVRRSNNDVTASKIIDYAGTAAIEDARRELPSSISSYNPSSPAAPKALPSGTTVDSPEVTVLPGVLPPSEWLAWFDTRPHGLLAAETGGGKSTTAKAILGSRIERGEYVFLLDPHSSAWFGLPGIGGGEDWNAVWVGMQVVIAEYKRRMTARDAFLKQHGKELPHDYFPRLTVLLDEANTACRKLNTARRGEESPWEQFAEALGSGARKVAISILMLAQSPNVEDIGLSGPMRQNFTRLALDAATTRLMIQKEETDPQRKPLLLDALRGSDFPATSVQRGSVVLLDRTGLDQVNAPHNPRASLWVEGYERVEMQMRPRQVAVAASVRPSSTVSASIPVSGVPVRTDGRTDEENKTLTYLRAFVRAGKTRDDARAWFDKKGLDFSNKLYTEARRLEGKVSK